MPKRNNTSKSQYPNPGAVTNQIAHTHTPTLGQEFIMSVNDRESSRHGTGRRFADPTRTQDSDGVLMGGGVTDVGMVSTHGGVGSAMGDNSGSVVEVDQHQVMGTGSGYYLRGGQPRQLQLQGQSQGRPQGRRCGQQGHSEVVGAGDEVDGHGVGISSGSDTDDLDTTLEGDDPVDVVQRPHSLIGDQCITPERRQYSLVGSLQTTEEQRRPAAAAGYDDNESITGFKPHSLCLSSDVNCFDSVDYSHI